MARIATKKRTTKETDIEVTLNLDGIGNNQIDTGIGFFDHMLDGMARHGLFDLTVKVNGDLDVDCHHTIEDTGIVIGQAILEAVGDKAGIKRFGHMILPMDETLALCALDLSGRPYLKYDAEFTVENIGELDTEMIKEFFYAISFKPPYFSKRTLIEFACAVKCSAVANASISSWIARSAFSE